MADGTTRRGRRAAPEQNGDEAKDRTPTTRTVLRRERVIVLPDDVTDEALAKLTSGDGAKQLAKLLGIAGKVPTVGVGVQAWLVVGDFNGESKTKAIEAHAGKAGTPDAKPGVYKAPPAAGFRGGEVYEKPPEPKVERKALID